MEHKKNCICPECSTDPEYEQQIEDRMHEMYAKFSEGKQMGIVATLVRIAFYAGWRSCAKEHEYLRRL